MLKRIELAKIRESNGVYLKEEYEGYVQNEGVK